MNRNLVQDKRKVCLIVIPVGGDSKKKCVWKRICTTDI